MNTYKVLLSASAIAIVTASGAFAQQFNGVSLTYGTRTLDIAGTSLDDQFFSATGDVGFSPQFGSYFGVSRGGISNGVEATTFSIMPYYEVSPGVKLGAFYDSVSIDGGSVTSSDGSYYGLEASFDSGNGISGSLFFGAGELATTSDAEIYGVEANYQALPSLDVGIFYRSEDIGTTSVSEYGLTVGYGLQDLIRFPLYLSGEVSRFEILGFEGDSLSINLTVPLGGAVPKGRMNPSPHSTFVDAVNRVF